MFACPSPQSNADPTATKNNDDKSGRKLRMTGYQSDPGVLYQIPITWSSCEDPQDTWEVKIDEWNHVPLLNIVYTNLCDCARIDIKSCDNGFAYNPLYMQMRSIAFVKTWSWEMLLTFNSIGTWYGTMVIYVYRLSPTVDHETPAVILIWQSVLVCLRNISAV